MTDITANVVVSMPSQLFTMARSFKAVANGKIYIGKIDTDPVNPENQIQVYVENEDGSHVPVSQPIIINAAGYPVYNGQIAKFVTVQGHSMAVYDAYGAQQFYYPNVLKYDPDQFSVRLGEFDGAFLIGGNAIYFSRPEFFGAAGDGITDDTIAIKEAISSGKPLSLSGRDWRITSSIELPDGYAIDMRDSNIIADIPGNPIFIFNGKDLGLSIIGGGGIVSGNASAFLLCTGLSNTPVNSDYVKQIRIHGVHVSSPNIATALRMDNAVRQIFIDSCMFFTKNGIVGNGKIVELKCHKSIIYGSTSDLDSVGVQSISPGGSKYYSEGWHFTDCTIDNFEKALDIRDMFAFTLNGGYVGCNSTTGYAASFGGRSTTHCREINIDSIFGGKIIFVSEPTGWIVNAKISGILTRVNSGICLEVSGNASGIDFIGLKFESSPAVCAVVRNNCSNISFSDITTDESPTFGIQFTGSSGSGCSVDGFVYRGSDNSFFLQRPVLLKNITTSTSTESEYMQKTSMVSPGTFPVSGTIATVVMSIAKGSRGYINIGISFSGSNVSTQNIQLSLPSGIVVPSATGVSTANTILNSQSGFCGRLIPFYATKDVSSGSFVLKNQSGNALSITSHSSLSVTLL